MGYNIACGKIGKSTQFNREHWSSPIAPNESPVFYQTIATLNPQNIYYFVGKTDYSRLSTEMKKWVTPHDNIVNIWDFFDKTKDDPITFPYEYFLKNNIKIDFGMFYSGSVAAVNIPELVYKKDKAGNMKDEYVKVLETYKNYAAPVVDYLNRSGIKYFTMSPDPRYVPIGFVEKNQDILNVEKFSMTLFDGTREVQRFKSFENQNEFNNHKVDCFYTAIEAVILMGLEKSEPMSLNKAKGLVIFHNDGGTKELDRGKVIKEYVLDNGFADAEIIGKWDDKYTDPDSKFYDARFKGPVTFEELQKILPEVKYTFMVPIERGAVSMKFWESVHNNVVPFMHDFYDTDKYLKCPDFIRIKDATDLKQKIDFLEANPEEYYKLRQQLTSMLTEEMYNGTFINNMVNKYIQKLLTEY
jgi:hypothetical protein